MKKGQLIPIIFLLLWFSYTFSFYTTLTFVEFSTDLLTIFKRNEIIPNWLLSIISIILVNLDQYFSLAVTGIAIGLIFQNRTVSFFVLICIYFAHIIPNIYFLIFANQPIEINGLLNYFTSKMFVYIIEFLFIYCGMKLPQIIQRK